MTNQRFKGLHQRLYDVPGTSVEPVGDLCERHSRAGVDLRFVTNLAEMRATALSSGLPFSIVRYRTGTFPGGVASMGL